MSSTTQSSVSTRTALRLLHASDMHLERVPSGLTEIPEHLRGQLVESSYTSARRVFETALAEQVDALLLAGDVVDLSIAGPRAIVFLRKHFEKLAAQDIEVYWVGGRVDPPDQWPQVSPLPQNVHVFPAGQVQSIPLCRGSETVAHIAGASFTVDQPIKWTKFVPHGEEVPTIGLAYGNFAQRDLASQQIPYLALGGRHRRRRLVNKDRSRLAHYPGATQGCTPTEAGPHGYTLVSLESDGRVRLRPLSTSALRWEVQDLETVDPTNPLEIERQLVSAAEMLRESAEGALVLVQWRLTGLSPTSDILRRPGAKGPMIDRLRARFGHEAPQIWTVGIQSVRKAELPERVFEEDTILGDVLREIRTLREEPVDSLQLHNYLSEVDREGWLLDRLTSPTSEDRGRIFEDTQEQCLALLQGTTEAPS